MPIFIDTTSATRRDKFTFQEGEGVDTKSLSYARQKARWDLTIPLRGGADAMRDKGVAFLAMEKGEKLPEYVVRLGRTHLLGAYDDAIDKLVAAPFSREVALHEADQLSEMLSKTEEDPDLDGGSVTTFFRTSFDTAVDRGLAHVLVEFANVEEGLNAAEEEELGIHPYFVNIDPNQLIGIRFRTADSGVKELLQIRIKTTVIENLEDFGEQEVETIRIYTAPIDEESGWWELWRLDPDDEVWERSQGPTKHSYPGVPLVTMYLEKVGDLEGRPTLWPLAELNLEHWQKKSDQDNLLHVARVPILSRFGWTSDELKKPILIGAGRSVGSTNKDARMEYVEHSGRALGAGQLDLDRIEEQMERAGLEPLARRAQSTLATNIMVGAAKEVNLLQAWASITEVFIMRCFEVAARWIDEELPEEFAVDIYSEFGLSARATENLEILDAARTRREISHETYLAELKRYAVLSSSIEIEEEIERVQTEAPLPGAENGTKETQEEEKGQTGTTNGHNHPVVPGASVTGPGGDDDHTHDVAPGAIVTGPASNGDDHTHTVPQGEIDASLAA